MAKLTEWLKKGQYVPFIFIFGLSLTTLFWFKNGTVVYFHDEIIPLNPNITLSDYLNMWRDSINLGTASSGSIPKLLPYYIFYLFNLFGLSVQTTEKIFYLLTVLTAGTGMYILSKYLIGPNRLYSRISSFIASYAYIVSPFIVEYIWRLDYIITRAWFYAFITYYTLILLLLMRRKNRSYQNILLLSLSGIVGGLISPSFSHPAFFIMFIVVILGCITYGVLIQQIPLMQAIYKLILVTLVSSIINLYWLVPRSVTAAAEYVNASSVGLLNTYVSNSNVIDTLKSLFIGDTPSMHDNIPWYSWSGFYSSVIYVCAGFILVLICLIKYLINRNKQSLIILLAFLSIFVVYVGSQKPFSNIKLVIFERISILQAFRDPSKWGFLLLPIFCIMLAMSVMTILKSQYRKYVKFFLPILVLVCISVLGWPFLSSRTIPPKYVYEGAQIKVPNEYYAVSQLINDNDKNAIIQFPLHGAHNSAVWSNDNGYKGVDVLRTLSGQPILDTNINFYGQQILRGLQTNLSKKVVTNSQLETILNNFNSKYIIVNKDFDYHFIRFDGLTNLSSNLNALPAIKKVYSSNFIDVYKRVESPQNKLFIAQGAEDYALSKQYSSKMISSFSDWEIVNNSNEVHRINDGDFSVKNLNNGSTFYLKNRSKLNINPIATPYISISYKNIPKDMKIAVSAEDSNGYSEWIPNVTNIISKFTNLSNGQYVFDLSSFDQNVNTLRINFTKETSVDTGSSTINLISLDQITNLTNFYSIYSTNNLNENVLSSEKAFSNTATISDVAKTSPTKYVFSLKGTGSILIGSYQQSDNNWVISYHGKVLKDVFKNIQINASQSGWIVDLDKMCSRYNLCIKNESITFSLEYVPQRSFNLSLLISVLSVITLTGVALSILIMKRVKNIELL